MVSPLNAFLTSSNASSMVDALFKPLASQDTGTAAASTSYAALTRTLASFQQAAGVTVGTIQAILNSGGSGIGQTSASAVACAYAEAAAPAESWYTLQQPAGAPSQASTSGMEYAWGTTKSLMNNDIGPPAPGSPYSKEGAIFMLQGLQSAASALTDANEAAGVGAQWLAGEAAATKAAYTQPGGTSVAPDAESQQTWDALQKLTQDSDPYIRAAAQSFASRVTEVGDHNSFVSKLANNANHGGAPETPAEAVAQFLGGLPDEKIMGLVGDMVSGSLYPGEHDDVAQKLRAVANNSVILLPTSAMPQFQQELLAPNPKGYSLQRNTVISPNNSELLGGSSDMPNFSMVAIFPPGGQPTAKEQATITASTLQITQSLTLTKASNIAAG